MAGYKNRHILTYTGKLVDPFNINPDDIDIVDIAHALSQICRYNGHTLYFYSVAHHSLFVSQSLEENFQIKLARHYHETDLAYLEKVGIERFKLELPLQGLLHDSAEAYIHDISGPLKAEPEFDKYKSRELELEKRIMNKFHLPFPMLSEIKTNDIALLRKEQRSIMRWHNPHKTEESWSNVEISPDELPSPKQTERQFLDRFYYLYGRLNYQQMAS